MAEKTRRRISFLEASKKEYEVDRESFDKSLDDTPPGPRFGCRHVQMILLCLALLFGFSTRSNISVAIVAMTDNTTSPNPDVPAYDWNNTSVILSSFFWSYVTLQVLAGYLGRRYGPKYFLLVTFFINCCACALTPFAAAKLGSVGVILCRVVQGFSQGFLCPSIHVMLGTWAPNQERTTLNNFVFSGVGIGSVYASILTGYIAASWWGWEYSFYMLAGMGYLWCILWAVLGQNSPATHPRITVEEKIYIQSSLKQEDDVHLPVPWKKIFTCIPFYALIVAYIGNCFGFAIVTIEMPTFLAKVMNFDVKSNAVVTAISTAFSLVASYITGPLSDWLIVNKYLSAFNARRFSHVIGSMGQACCLVWLSYLSQASTIMAITILTIGNISSSFVLVGCNINHLDLSPRFAGIIFGILNAIGQGASIVAPLVAQWLITDSTDVTQWRIIFLMSVGFFGVGSLAFFFFGSATRQPWDGPETKDLERRKKVSVVSLTGV